MLKYLVYLLGVLIIITFSLVIYGIYIKSSLKTSKKDNLNQNISLLLNNNQKIKDIQVINEQTILVTIIDGNEIKGIIYDIKNQQLIQRIGK